MKFKISFLFVAMMMVSVCDHAQSARNPLNMEPANIRINKGVSPKKLAGMTFYRPDGMQFDKTDIAYGENGRKISELNLRWNAADGTWADVSKNEYMYTDNSQFTLSSVYTGDTWRSSSKTEYHYNASGKTAYTLTYGWNKKTGSWPDQPATKKDWKYDEKGRASESVKWYFNKKTETWDIPLTRILYAYDEEGNQREEIIQSYDNGSWKDAGKYVYAYNEMQDEIVCMSYVISGNNWVYDGKIICSYDEDGDMTRCEYYDNRANGSMNAYCMYTYTAMNEPESIVKEEDINVYPNPAVNDIDLTVPEELVGKTAFFFDVAGKQNKAVLIRNASMKVDVSDLPTGVYFMKVDAYAKKIFVK